VPVKRHPCRSSADTGGNPRFKMHNCDSEGLAVDETPSKTICGLPTLEVDRVHGYTSLCPVCWPLEPWDGDPPEELPWTGEGEGEGREGDLISGR
jgi:hypothetical protein